MNLITLGVFTLLGLLMSIYTRGTVKWVPFGSRASVLAPHTTKTIHFPYGNDINCVARPHKVPLGDKAPNQKSV